MGGGVIFYRNTVLTLVFLFCIGYGAVETEVLHNLADETKIIFAVGEQKVPNSEIKLVTGQSISIGDVNTAINDLLPYHEELVNLSGTVIRVANVRSYYNQEFGINITKDGYVIGRYDKTSTDYEISQIIQLKEYLDERGIGLLYVNEPAKYIDDSVYENEFGGESYLNRNADLFLRRLREEGIHYVDLRDNIVEEDIDSLSLFYRTDHHWTVPAAKWAAEIIAEKLNDAYGYNIDLNLYADDNFNYTKYEDCWLGEQGQLVGESYIGLDDFTLVIPAYKTNFLRYWNDNIEEGDFDLFVNYNTFIDYYGVSGKVEQAKFKSWHYSYIGEGYIQNNYAEYGNILVLGDSYGQNLIPFMALGIRNIYKIEPRNMSDGEVLNTIESGNYDTVILTYGQFMIGAHDSDNANTRMFSFFD